MLNGSYAQKLPKVVFLPDTLAIKILDTLNLTFWKLRKITDISTGNAALTETNCSQTSIVVQRAFSSNNNLGKLVRKVQQFATEKEKYDFQFLVWFDLKREKALAWTK